MLQIQPPRGFFVALADPSGLPSHEVHQNELPQRHRVREVGLPGGSSRAARWWRAARASASRWRCSPAPAPSRCRWRSSRSRARSRPAPRLSISGAMGGGARRHDHGASAGGPCGLSLSHRTPRLGRCWMTCTARTGPSFRTSRSRARTRGSNRGVWAIIAGTPVRRTAREMRRASRGRAARGFSSRIAFPARAAGAPVTQHSPPSLGRHLRLARASR